MNRILMIAFMALFSTCLGVFAADDATVAAQANAYAYALQGKSLCDSGYTPSDEARAISNDFDGKGYGAATAAGVKDAKLQWGVAYQQGTDKAWCAELMARFDKLVPH